MDGDKPILAANTNCHKLSRVSWALAQISCYLLIWVCWTQKATEMI